MRYTGGACVGGDRSVRGGFLRIIKAKPRDDGTDAKTAGNDTIIGGATPAGGGAGGEMNIE